MRRLIPQQLALLLMALSLATGSCRAQPAPPAAPTPAARPAPALPPGARALRDLEYARVGETSLQLDLYLPAASGAPAPLLLWVHGGAWRGGSKEGTPALRLLTQGYAVASLNYRLSAQAVWPAQIQDCRAAVRWLRGHAAEYNLDPQRFAAWGSSAGGHLVAMLGTAADQTRWDTVGEFRDQSARVSAVLSFCGPYDLLAMVGQPSGIDRTSPQCPEALLIGGSLKDHPDRARDASPVTYVSGDEPPFLIVHGDQDDHVPVNQAQILAEALQAKGVPVTLKIIAGAGHGLGGPEVDAAVDAFLAQYFPAPGGVVTPPAPAATLLPAPPRGSRQVLKPQEIVLHDAARNKDLRVSVQLPSGEGPFPVIIFSHGYGGSGAAYKPLLDYWVSWGYACLAPTHADSLSLRLGRDPQGPRLLEEMTAGIRHMLQDPVQWTNRPRDLTFLLDSLDEVEKLAPLAWGKLDRKRIGVGGHSFGAYTTQLVGGAAITLPGETQPQSFADPRPVAFLALSGQGRGQMGLTETSWPQVTRPMMHMTGSEDLGALGQLPQWRKDAYDLAPAGDKWWVFLEGATHMSFTGLPSSGILLGRGAEADPGKQAREQRIFDVVKATSLAFWCTYLRGDPQARTVLSAAVQNDPPGTTLESR